MQKAPMDLVLEAVPECDRGWVTLEVYRFLGMTPDAGRPSDAARSIVRAYQNGTLKTLTRSLRRDETPRGVGRVH